MKRIIGIVFLTVLMASCGGDTTQSDNNTPNSTKGENSKGAGSSVTNDAEAQGEAGSGSIADIETLVVAYKQCKTHASNPNDCKEYAAMAFGKYYGFNFIGAGNTFLAYDKLHAAITMSNQWDELGNATDQDVLDKAQENANAGIPTIAVSTEGSKTVAIVVKGEKSHSNSLGLDCPSVAVFRPRKHNKSFVGKGINYAWSDLTKIKVYSLK